MFLLTESTVLFIDIDGGWGDWTSWSSCSETCGNGTETRTRECDNPEPTESGTDCLGNNAESQQCNAGACPGMLLLLLLLLGLKRIFEM